jgi:hypothetical protein
MSRLDKLLEEYASHATPSPPSNLEDAVWREIRRRSEKPAYSSAFEWLTAFVWRAHFVYSSAVAAIALGAVLAWFDLNTGARSTSHALNLHVFSERSPTLRLTSLYQQR